MLIPFEYRQQLATYRELVYGEVQAGPHEFMVVDESCRTYIFLGPTMHGQCFTHCFGFPIVAVESFQAMGWK